MEQPHVPHVMFLPYPAQGHIKPLLMLAELLSHAGFQVTFINTDHNHGRLLRHVDMAAFNSQFPNFLFMSIPDGLPPDHPRTGLDIDLFFSTMAVTKPAFRELLISLSQEKKHWQPPTCIIADSTMSFATDIAEELKIPIITFRTFSACCTWTYFHLSKLIEEREVPFQGDKEMDKPITCIPGLENDFRRRDLPSICRLEKADDPLFQFFIGETLTMTRASGLIINTFEELEAPMISKLGSFFTKIYSIGPLHALLKSHTTNESSPSASSNGILWKEDKSCMTWLDSKPLRSVIYVSFGSLVELGHDQLLEFWHGIVNSGKSFLWVIRPGMIFGEEGIGQIPVDLKEATKERGCMVDWAPQEEVLAHPAIGGFLTHSGWNSSLESIFAGVPMICWPLIADQQVNSRCVSEVWRIGFDMKDTCDRATVEKMVRDLMEYKKEEIMKSTDEIARMARDSIKKGGSSYCNLEKLIQDLRSMSLLVYEDSNGNV